MVTLPVAREIEASCLVTTTQTARYLTQRENGSVHFSDQSFAETFAESEIRTETKDQPKNEVVLLFRFDSAIVRTERSLNPMLINKSNDLSCTRW